jgi:hypothetical protein
MTNQEYFEANFLKNYHAAKYTDRGNKKWTAMMLTEHLKELRQDEADFDKVSQPLLDEYDLQMLQEEVGRALTSKLETKITSWKDGRFHYHRGVVHEVSTRYLVYEDPFGKHRLPIPEIVAVMIME